MKSSLSLAQLEVESFETAGDDADLEIPTGCTVAESCAFPPACPWLG
ncbi:MAG TPA: hypothetical protein VGC13_17745 [Longimicrobium sp.]|jgi:hypothetical protein